MISKAINKFVRILEEQAVEAIVAFLDKTPEFEFVELTETVMSFYPKNVMKGVKKFEEEGLEPQYLLVTEDETGQLVSYDIEDFGCVPITDLVAILEDIERHGNE